LTAEPGLAHRRELSAMLWQCDATTWFLALMASRLPVLQCVKAPQAREWLEPGVLLDDRLAQLSPQFASRFDIIR